MIFAVEFVCEWMVWEKDSQAGVRVYVGSESIVMTMIFLSAHV